MASSRTSQVFALLRTLVFAAFFIAGVLVYLPWAIGVFRWPDDEVLNWRLFGVLPLLAGICVGLHCVFAFAWIGRGTPAPFDPPRRLVVRGLYRYVRNPMYWGAFLILAGQWVLFGGGWPAAVFTAVFAACSHLFVCFYEEPALRRRFGADYDEYSRAVPRWIPRYDRQSSSRH